VVEDGGLKCANGKLANADASQLTSCGDLVKLIANPSGENCRTFAEVEATDTGAYGFVRKNLKQSQYTSGDLITVARSYDVIVGVANDVLSPGDSLVYIQATGKIDSTTNQTTGAGIIPCGLAASNASAGGLVQIEIRL
jgi:hypothetical protein